MALRLDIESPKGVQTIYVSPGRDRRLTDVLRREHLPLNTRCGQRGLCDGCMVELLSGAVIDRSGGQKMTGGSIRACEHRLAETDVCLRIPPRSLLAHKPQVVSEFRLNIPRAHDPVWQTVEVTPNGLVAESLAKQTKRRRPIHLAPNIPTTVTERHFATLEYRDDHWLVTHLREQPAGRTLGVAVDIGTTTVALLLVDLSDGEIIGRAADFNRQMHLGDDVATRIGLCSANPSMLPQLQEAVVRQTIQPLIATALQQASAFADEVVSLTVTANTTMLHLLAGVDPSPMGIYPFRPSFVGHTVLTLPEFGDATIHLLPSAAAYIGADLTAGILSSGLAYDDGPSLLVDVGTNGEIILKAGGKMLGCATAAGPAFEGAGLTNGIRAGEGAVEGLSFKQSPFGVQTRVIGNCDPIGICGSAYVDFLAAGRRTGLLTETGRFQHDADKSDWFQRIDDGWALRVTRGSGKQDILVSETDVAHLLQSKAAIGAGVVTLLERAGLKSAEIKTVYLAGGFGMHINVAHAIGCGLLPGFTEEQVEVVGNTSLAGAYLGLLDCGALDEVARIARQIEVVELNLDPQFESRYIDQLVLP
jgi:uncharacterized 2Fe-2S/4Fe-4S cluster protein (DUF4445 family)